MKAFLQQDIIINLTERGDTEIGALPKGIDLGRCRFDGKKVVDLASLATIHVVSRGPGAYELHAVAVPGSQPVAMTYADRKRLISDNGLIRVKTTQEISAEQTALQAGMEKARLRTRIDRTIGDIPDLLADLNKITFALLVFVLTGNARAEAMLRNLLPTIKDIYKFEDIEQTLMDRAAKLKEEMASYQETAP